MSEERDLIKKRGSFKGRLTAFVNFLDSLKDKELSSCNVSELQLRIGKMESLYEQYDEVQLRLECIVDDLKSQYSERSEFESLYYKSLAKAQNILSDFNKDNKSMESCKSTPTLHKPVKLPTIQLPKFSGLYCNWLEFRDTFASLIHSNDDIDTINKFHYLRASLEGTAALVIKSIEFSSSNYTVAWSLLCDRFDNRRLLIQNHVCALFNIESISKESSVAIKSLIDQLNKDLRALDSLGEPVKHWDTLLIYIVTRKLDQKTYREWEEYKGRMDKDCTITFDAFMLFLRNRADLIETLELARTNYSQTTGKSAPKIKSMVATQSPNSSSTESASKSCPKCNHNDHTLNNCPQFLVLSNDDRLKLLPSYKICFNCFHSGHYANKCKKPGCKLCKRRHNTLVHVDSKGTIANTLSGNSMNNLSASSSLPSATTDTNNVALSANIASPCSHTQRDVLLSTALVKLRDHNGCVHLVRAVLDSGSTSSFITDRLCNKLNLTTSQVNRSILGINNVTSHVGKTCRVKITSLDDGFIFNLHCFVLPYITSNVPSREINTSDFDIPSNITLADPTFFNPADVDILIGADLFWELLGSQRLKLGSGKPILCETRLGWIVSGPISQNYISLLSNDVKCHFSKMVSDSDSDWEKMKIELTKFWQLEEVNAKSSNSYMPEEKLCEDNFVKNTTRLSDGRFCVRIPLKKDPSILGNSFNKATHCLQSLERRLKVKPDFSRLYRDFLLEYESLAHMTKINKPNLCVGYFIPHHGILRESSSTTKLRVVFNASCPTSTGVSSNGLQMVGPTVQDDLLSILLRFRFHKYVLSADVEKMYRQIVVHPSDRYLQQIVWRDNINEPINVYQLNTVTYGTASAPFLATRCLKQIGLDCRNPKIAEIIRHDFYVDDLLTGGNDLDEAKFIRTEVTKALASACMPLRKWKSNNPQLVSDAVPASFDLNIGPNEPDKLLGLGWFIGTDELGFPISLTKSLTGYTKRDVLSVIARIFDPLGLLGPIVISMKVLLQKMWLDKLSWDQPLPNEMNNGIL